MPVDDDPQVHAAGPHPLDEHWAGVLDALATVGSDLELPEVLSRAVRSACALTRAGHAVLEVLRPDGEVAATAAHGSPTAASAHSGLEVPVRVADETVGTLHVTGKPGAEAFSPEDEALLTGLATVVGVAVDHTRLLGSSRRLRLWSEALADLTQTLLAGPQEQPALDRMAALAGHHAAAALAFVLLYDEDGALVVRARHTAPTDAAAGPAEPLGVGCRIDPEGWETVTAATVRRTGDATPGRSWPRGVAEGVGELAGVATSGAAIMPLGPGRDRLGFLVVVWTLGQDPADDEAARPLVEFGQHAGLALLAARSQRDQTLSALLDDRDRIARDMHDHVIQRLFATGLSLQSAARLAVHPTVRERLDDAVDDLDGAIKDIRHTIYELHRMPAGSLRDEIAELIGEAAEPLGFEPALLIEGRLAGLTDSLTADLLAVVREALANVAKHARATAVRVHVRCDEQVRVVVTDDGVGMDPAAARSGLVNLGTRAASRGGRFEIGPGTPTGTVLSWTVPADRET